MAQALEPFLPEACTLTFDERPARIVDLAALLQRVTTSRRPSPTSLAMVVDAGLRPSAERLAAAEQACCSFLTIEVRPGAPGSVEVLVLADAGHADLLDDIEAMAHGGR